MVGATTSLPEYRDIQVFKDFTDAETLCVVRVSIETLGAVLPLGVTILGESKRQLGRHLSDVQAPAGSAGARHLLFAWMDAE
ncbi:hypothetical protein [Kutzneria chonburiensis]|uniref:hypothetical protein n=1 Tax=Kutzneria chonburiensis TaxID=1483604 RepID=UPI002361C4CA|nr:hypothetical protein [Kutzneria chonburiensis]